MMSFYFTNLFLLCIALCLCANVGALNIADGDDFVEINPKNINESEMDGKPSYSYGGNIRKVQAMNFKTDSSHGQFYYRIVGTMLEICFVIANDVQAEILAANLKIKHHKGYFAVCEEHNVPRKIKVVKDNNGNPKYPFVYIRPDTNIDPNRADVLELISEECVTEMQIILSMYSREICDIIATLHEAGFNPVQC
ncbi:hypothetical protein Ddc_10081 [Ditylenchus destructor]|nr:hypothetical protein Ddc_10081 [Ditylenchus destructor]